MQYLEHDENVYGDKNNCSYPDHIEVANMDEVNNDEGSLLPSELADNGEEKSLKPPDYSDSGEAEVLVREYGDKLKYADATDYLFYDGRRWVEDKLLANNLMGKLLDLQLAEAMDEVQKTKHNLMNEFQITEEDIDLGKVRKSNLDTYIRKKYYLAYQEAQKYLEFVLKHRDNRYIKSTLETAKSKVKVEVEDLDRNAFLLNTPDGTYDLSKGMAGKQPHDPKDLITKITKCPPGDKGNKLWQEFLIRIFCGDAELIEYVQKIIGMAAIGKVFQEHIILAWGGGSNGKSSLFNAIFRVLGNYSGKISADALAVSCRRNVKPEMAELRGKRLAVASELEEGMRLNTAMVKQLCSTDEIFSEKKFKAPAWFAPSHSLIVYSNHLPKIGADDDGIWRRIIVIPFNIKITGTSEIKNYADFLYENAGEAIVKWIIEGAQKAIAADFKIPIPYCVEQAIQAYRRENDWLSHFIEECCDLDKNAWQQSGELYHVYRGYCKYNGEYVRSTTDFYSAIRERGYVKQKTNKGAYIQGLKLKPGKDIFSYLRAAMS